MEGVGEGNRRRKQNSGKGARQSWGAGGGGQREEARITSYKQVGIIVSRIDDARNVNTTKSASHHFN